MMISIFLYSFLFLSLYAVTNHLLSKLRRLPPSPFPALPILGHLHLLKKPLHLFLTSLSSSFGPVLLLQFGSRCVLVVSSPSTAEECLSKNDILFANRPQLLAGKFLGNNYTSLVSCRYGDHWRNLRRLASLELLSASRVQMLSHVRSDEVRSLVKQLAARIEGINGAHSVDMKSAFFDLMLNVVMMIIAGKRYCGEGTDSEDAREFQDLVTETFRVSGATNVGEFLPFLKWFGVKGMEERLIKLQQRRDGFMQRLIDEKRGVTIHGDEKRKTLMDVMLSLRENDPENCKDEMIKSLMLVMLTAGTDTTASTMEWTMSLLLNHPEALKKAQTEIDRVVGNGRLVSESDLPNLPYLQCVIYESLRMKPVGPLSVPHESSEECQVGGYRVPGGTMLLVNLYAIQNSSKYWEDADMFLPERFEGQEGPRDGYRMMPFGSGRRGCPGENLAMRMVGMTLGTLIQCFEWEHGIDGPVDMTEETGLNMPKVKPLVAKYRTRAAVVDLVAKC